MSTAEKSFDDVIRKQVSDALKKWKPSDVTIFNGSSWMNLIFRVTGHGYLDCDAKVEVTPEDRAVAAELLRKALRAAASCRIGLSEGLGMLMKRIKGAPRIDVIDFYKERLGKLPPAVEPKPRGTYNGVTVMESVPDPAHLERHEVFAALVLEAYERDPNWKPTEQELGEWVKRVGIR